MSITPDGINNKFTFNVALGGAITIQAPNTASSYTFTLPQATGTGVVFPIPATSANKINFAAYANTSALGDIWLDSTTQTFEIAVGGTAQQMNAWISADLYVLKVPQQVTTAKNGTYATLLNTASQTFTGTNTLKANFLTAGKHIYFKISGVLTIASANSTATAKLQIGGADLVISPATASITVGANIPFTIEGIMQVQVLGAGANSTVNGWIKFDVHGYAGVQAFTALTTVNATGTLVVDCLVTTAGNNANTFTPYAILIETRG